MQVLRKQTASRICPRESFSFRLQEALGRQGEGGFWGAAESIKQSIKPSPASGHDLGDHCIELSANHFRLKSTFSRLAAHRESTDRERDKKQSQKKKEGKKAFTFAFRGWTAPFSVKFIICHRTVNLRVSNKRKMFVTAVSYNRAKGEISGPALDLPILDLRRW